MPINAWKIRQIKSTTLTSSPFATFFYWASTPKSSLPNSIVLVSSIIFLAIFLGVFTLLHYPLQMILNYCKNNYLILKSVFGTPSRSEWLSFLCGHLAQSSNEMVAFLLFFYCSCDTFCASFFVGSFCNLAGKLSNVKSSWRSVSIGNKQIVRCNSFCAKQHLSIVQWKIWNEEPFSLRVEVMAVCSYFSIF